ncbi:hypothetical protein DFA_09680 [Cavenderia fasciculata]|uniref:Uncharacterized protein n=1 Tax=Cavenderia fasciculata TaxID=261658 RepID=F4Q8A8_CACFS|nr:uncharacterized protein DFA_09680 [Cavenderia fasciculata]EGG16008.1 hypothetical protein DFA_09680 [Cavenderia fasciculata]|eukprot:XP_004352333.1 hypothetical protein DFA_09680 [Cavenderia fasciculata]
MQGPQKRVAEDDRHKKALERTVENDQVSQWIESTFELFVKADTHSLICYLFSSPTKEAKIRDKLAFQLSKGSKKWTHSDLKSIQTRIDDLHSIKNINEPEELESLRITSSDEEEEEEEDDDTGANNHNINNRRHNNNNNNNNNSNNNNNNNSFDYYTSQSSGRSFSMSGMEPSVGPNIFIKQQPVSAADDTPSPEAKTPPDANTSSH